MAMEVQLTMTDHVSSEGRSRIMSAIRSSGTIPENRLYEAVRGELDHRWRIERNVATLPGKPDLLIPSLWLALFVDGCFFHLCPEHGSVPESNRDYWEPKLARNVKRDGKNRRLLRNAGFAVWRFWEHELRPEELKHTHRRIRRRLSKRLREREDLPSRPAPIAVSPRVRLDSSRGLSAVRSLSV